MGVRVLSEHVHEAVDGERRSRRRAARGAPRPVRAPARPRRKVDADVEETARLLRRMDEMLGLAPQLSLDAHGELRGQKLQEIAVELLRQKKGPASRSTTASGMTFCSTSGFGVGGKDPLGDFLTQIGRAPDVESVRPRSGSTASASA